MYRDIFFEDGGSRYVQSTVSKSETIEGILVNDVDHFISDISTMHDCYLCWFGL